MSSQSRFEKGEFEGGCPLKTPFPPQSAAEQQPFQTGSQQAETVRIDLPAGYKHLNILSACIAELLAHVELPERATQVYSAQLAAHEVCTNIIEHAYAGVAGARIAITLTLEPQPRRLTIEVQDHGRAFDPAAVQPADLSRPRDHGYGLLLIHNLMDEVTYAAEPERNRWRLVKHL